MFILQVEHVIPTSRKTLWSEFPDAPCLCSACRGLDVCHVTVFVGSVVVGSVLHCCSLEKRMREIHELRISLSV